jgi:hypothetical protein
MHQVGVDSVEEVRYYGSIGLLEGSLVKGWANSILVNTFFEVMNIIIVVSETDFQAHHRPRSSLS